MSALVKLKTRWVVALLLVAAGTVAIAVWFWWSPLSPPSRAGGTRLSVEALRAEVPDYFTVDPARVNGTPGVRSAAFSAEVTRWAVSASPSRSVQELDASVVAYLRDRNVSRTEKISTLLALSRSAATVESRRYLIDCVAALQPLEFAGQLIDDYRRSSTTEDKVALLRAVASAFSFADSGRLVPALLANVELIQAFFRKEFAENTDPVVFSELLRTAHSIIPAAEASTILQTASGLANVRDADIGDFYINALVADKAQQQQLIAQVTELYQSGKLTGATDFVNKLLVLIEADRERNIFDARLLEKALPLLKSTEPALNADVGFVDVVAYARWARAVLAASNPGASLDQGNAATALLDFATKVEPIKAAAIIAVLTPADLENTMVRSALIARLEAALASPELSGSQRKLIGDALARLRTR